MSCPSFYWEGHERDLINNRLAWFAEPADESFWFSYWRERVTPQYYQSASQINLGIDELGKVLLKELDLEGIHLEAGCGAGFWIAALRPHGFNVEGIEYAQHLVEHIQMVNPMLPIQYGDALNINQSDCYYNSYLSFGVVEHRLDGPEPFLAEAFRVLKENGKIIISVPHFGWLRHQTTRFKRKSSSSRSEFFQYGFTQTEFCGLLEGAGFIVNYCNYLYLHRLLIEEIKLYRWLAYKRGGYRLKKIVEHGLRNRDGHMLLVVAHKPEGK